MRLLFTTQPASGHLGTLLPLIKAARAAGHTVAVCSGPSFRADVEGEGLDFYPAGRDWLMSEAERYFDEVPPEGPERMLWVMNDVFAEGTARDMAGDLQGIVDDFSPDVLVREPAEFGACIVAERLDLPHACVSQCGGTSLYQLRHVLADPLDRLRAEFGLPADDDVEMPFRYLHLFGLPPEYDGSRRGFPPTAHLAASRPEERSTVGSLPEEWLAEHEDRPLVFASLGTVVNRTAGVHEAILEGLRDEPIALLIAVGRNRDPTALGPVPEHVRVETFVAQSLVLERCAAFVTHNGFVSTTDALLRATPMVSIPHGADPSYHARRCAALGLSIRLGPGDRTPSDIRDAVRRVLADDGFAVAAAAWRDRVLALPPMSHGVDLLQRLVASGRPLESVPS